MRTHLAHSFQHLLNGLTAAAAAPHHEANQSSIETDKTPALAVLHCAGALLLTFSCSLLTLVVCLAVSLVVWIMRASRSNSLSCKQQQQRQSETMRQQPGHHLSLIIAGESCSCHRLLLVVWNYMPYPAHAAVAAAVSTACQNKMP
jgi:hypothetical protein